MTNAIPPWTILTALLCTAPSQAELRTGVIEYRQGDTVLEGYLAYDSGLKGPRPGVLVVHEWTGINAYVKRRVEQLAQLGYVALAADIYGRGVRPKTPEEAAKVAAVYRNDRALMRARAQAAVEMLRHQEGVDPKRIAAIGYCFGGTIVLELARSGADIAGVVSFHGGLDTPHPEDARNIKCKVLVLHGGDDPHVPIEQVTGFCQEMRKAGVDWQLIVYGGAVHSFTNPESGSDPSRGVAYSERADRRSWQAMRLFFDEIIQAPGR